MDALSIFEMIWQLGVLVCVAAPMIILVGMVIFMMFKPINALDNL